MFENLAETSNEWLKTQEVLITRITAANETQKDQQEAEGEKTTAKTARDSPQAQLDREKDAGKKVKLNELLIVFSLSFEL